LRAIAKDERERERAREREKNGCCYILPSRQKLIYLRALKEEEEEEEEEREKKDEFR
jgi:hypothetical protein